MTISNQHITQYLQTAREALNKAAEISLGYYNQNLKVELKEDATPVTVADKQTEQVIIDHLSKVFPEHGFYGEETGATNDSNEFVWIIDPIDGTKNYIGGIPLWGTLVALRYQNDIIMGLSHIPLMNELLFATKNGGAFLNDQQVKVSSISTISEAMLSFGSIKPYRNKNFYDGLMRLINDSKRQRSFGDLYPYHLLASGKLEIVCEAAIKLVDVAPFDLIIKEAGGQTSTMTGQPLDDSINHFLATNGRLHLHALNYFL